MSEFTDGAVAAVFTAHRAVKKPRTLIIDKDVRLSKFANEDGAIFLSQLGLDSLEMWTCNDAQSMKLIVLSFARPANELYRVLSFSERLVSPGGVILILPFANDIAGETRIEATEIFCGIHRNWERRMLSSNVMELRKLERNPESNVSSQAVRETFFSKNELVALAGIINGSRAKVDSIVEPSMIIQKHLKRVVSLSIFGDSRFANDFWQPLPEYMKCYVLAHHALFPGYELRIHHDDALYAGNWGDVLHGLQRHGLVKLVYMGSNALAQGKCRAMLWRFAPAWDPEVDYVFTRDVDSLPTWRERCVVEEEIQSAERGETNLFTIWDNPAHEGIMGGLSGVRAEALRAIYPTFNDFINAAGFDDSTWSKHGADQDFLNAVIRPKMKILEHSVFKSFAEDGITRTFRSPSTGTVQFKVDVIPFDDPAVSTEVRESSNGLINYMGAAGYAREKALKFYEERSPVSEVVHAAEIALGKNDSTKYGDYAILSSDDNLDYSFFIPLTCRLWALRKYTPVLLLVGTPDHWLGDRTRKLAVDHARESGAQIYWTGNFQSIRTSTVAQVVRIFAAALPVFRDNDYLIVSDIDMFPLGPWVGNGRDMLKELHIWGANCYRGESVFHFPMCYIGARARTWREITRVSPGKFNEALSEAVARAPEDSDGAWNYDERLLGNLIKEWSGWPSRTQEIDRGQHQPDGSVFFDKSQWRIDRSMWDESLQFLDGSLEGVADAHLLRPGFGPNWSRIRPILAMLFLPEQLEWADGYVAAWEQRDQ